MKIKYFKQETCWTCGPAVIRMFLYTIGIKKSEKQLIKLLKSNKIVGTRQTNIIHFAIKKNFKILTGNNSTINELKKLLKLNYFIIVSYNKKVDEKCTFKFNKNYVIEENHFSVISKITNRDIYLIDPVSGPEEIIKINNFKKMWAKLNHYEKDKCWFIALKK